MKRHARHTTIGVALATAVVLVPFAHATDGQVQTAAPVEVTATSANVGQYLAESASRPVLLDFATSWCQYCKVLNPILKAEATAAKGSWLLAHIDGDSEKQGLNVKYAVSTYPTVIVMSKGTEVAGTRLTKWPGTESAVKTWLSLALKAAKATSKLPAGTPTSTPKPTASKPTAPAPAPGGAAPSWPGLPAPMTTGKFAGAIDVTSGNHDALMKESSKRLVLIDFSKEGCLPCENLAPHLRSKNAGDKDWVWGILDGTKYTDLWQKYGNAWFPTMLAFKDGKEIARHVGFEGNFTEVSAWIDALRSGKVPPSAETKMNITSDESLARAVQLSKGKTIAVRFATSTEDEMSTALDKLAEADKGKWVYAVVDAKSPFGTKLATSLSAQPGVDVMTVLYEGRTWKTLVPNLEGVVKDEAKLKEFVKKMTTTYYKPGTPADGPGLPGGGAPAPLPTDVPAPPGAPQGPQGRPAPPIPPAPGPVGGAGGAPPSGMGGIFGRLLSFPMMLLKLLGLGM